MSDVLRLFRDPDFLALWQEGGLVYRAMEAAQAEALSPKTPMERVRVLQGRLQGLSAVRELVVKAAQAESQAGPGPTEDAPPEVPMPRLMRVVQGGS